MKLSTRSRYGLRLLIDLSQQNGECVSLSAVAERQEVSASYLELVAKDLKRAGLIRAIKGAGGGYVLAKPSSEISVGEVLRILEGDMAITEQTNDESPLGMVVNQMVFDKVNDRLADYFDGLSLTDVIAQKTDLGL